MFMGWDTAFLVTVMDALVVLSMIHTTTTPIALDAMNTIRPRAVRIDPHLVVLQANALHMGRTTIT